MTTDIQIGLATSTADIVMNRRVKMKGGRFPLQSVENRVMQGEYVVTTLTSGSVTFDIPFTEVPVIGLTSHYIGSGTTPHISVILLVVSGGLHTGFNWASSKAGAGVFWTAIGTVD